MPPGGGGQHLNGSLIIGVLVYVSSWSYYLPRLSMPLNFSKFITEKNERN